MVFGRKINVPFLLVLAFWSTPGQMKLSIGVSLGNSLGFDQRGEIARLAGTWAIATRKPLSSHGSRKNWPECRESNHRIEKIACCASELIERLLTVQSIEVLLDLVFAQLIL